MNQPTMTAEQARTFEHGTSSNNAAMLQAVLPCNCKPYEDIFTYGRWKAQGFQVRRGEKSKKITTYKTGKTKVDEKTGEETPGRKFAKKSAVFCRCQVKPIE